MSALPASIRDETLALTCDDGNGATTTITPRAGRKNDGMGLGLLIHDSSCGQGEGLYGYGQPAVLCQALW
jgi:hypothetical protein